MLSPYPSNFPLFYSLFYSHFTTVFFFFNPQSCLIKQQRKKKKETEVKGYSHACVITINTRVSYRLVDAIFLISFLSFCFSLLAFFSFQYFFPSSPIVEIEKKKRSSRFIFFDSSFFLLLSLRELKQREFIGIRTYKTHTNRKESKIEFWLWVLYINAAVYYLQHLCACQQTVSSPIVITGAAVLSWVFFFLFFFSFTSSHQRLVFFFFYVRVFAFRFTFLTSVTPYIYIYIYIYSFFFVCF